MTTNVTKTGTSYKFEIVEEEYVFSGTCENNLSNIHINGDIRNTEANQETPGNEPMAMAYNGMGIGSFNYNRNENSVDFNTNIYDRAAFNDVYPVILNVINAIIEEVTK